MGRLTNLNPSKALTEADMPLTMATDSEVTTAINAHINAADPHTQYLLQSEGDARYRQTTAGINFSSTIKSVGLSSFAISTPDNSYANKCGFEVQADAATSAAYMSFHRPTQWGIHFGLDTNNNLCVGGWSLGNVAYKIQHEGFPLCSKGGAFPLASGGANSVQVGWNSIEPGKGVAEIVNYAGTGGGDAFSFYRIFGTGAAGPSASNKVSKIDPAGAYFQISDARMKTGLEPAPGLDVLLKLRPLKYSHHCDNNSGNRIKKIGLIAQEVERILPEAVSKPLNEGEFYSLDYTAFIPCLIQAMQEVNAKIDFLIEKQSTK